ncbi:unnamed protein product [Psylliodes chrysocephalus]|uniref:Uncharacterized protein n=1 Tax=Psylliodes chrysocephalus TaxID=3402493 RepID=A0A9P0D6E0_9CUCU|nr:unnamed protein product [Psylliodes chrysocephala]
MTDEKREKKRRKDRERSKKLKEEGRIKSIKDLDKREQRNIRKKWKVASLEYRKIKSQKGRKKVKHDRAECYRKLRKSQKIIEDLRNKLRNSQRKDRRQKLKIAALESSKERLPAETPSQATKINKLVEGFKVPEGVKRRLVLEEALYLQLKENVQQLKTQTEKQIAAKIISGKILRKQYITIQSVLQEKKKQ